MADFTSALFLDHRHPPGALAPWASLTSGRPAALREPDAALELAARVARSQTAEAGVVHRSVLHALCDVLDVLGRRRSAVVALDEAVYPIARWAAAGVAVRGVRVTTFPHRDATAVEALTRRSRGRAIIVTDGWCPDCSQPAPLAALNRAAVAHGGQVVVDDTLCVGVLGGRPGRAHPLGSGGGGTFPWLGVDRLGAVVVASLAKGYGAPLAVTTGPARLVRRLRTAGSRWHASPPSAVDLGAALAATADEAANDRRRARLARLVWRLRSGLRALGLPVAGRPFPIVSVPVRSLARALGLQRQLAAGGVEVLVRRRSCRPGHALTFAVTASHRARDIDQAIDVFGSLPPSAHAGVAA